MGISTGALAFPGDQGDRWGSATLDYRRCRSNQAKGAQKVDGSAPLLPLPRNPGISNSDDEIAAGLGRNHIGAGGVEWCRMVA